DGTPPMKPAISTVCSLNAPLETILEDYSAGQCRLIEVWLGHAEQYLDGKPAQALSELLLHHGCDPVAATFQGGLLTSQGDARREHWAHFEKRLALCSAASIPTLVLAGDVYGPLGPEDLGRLSASLVESAKRAADAGVRLALEFDARASFPNNLQSAVALIEDVGLPSLGICLDWFHFSVGPSKVIDLHLLTPETIALVQLSDIADVPREMATDADRILPGEGNSPPQQLIAHLEAMKYDGPISIELQNPQLWQVPPRQFGEIAITALRKLLGQAEMAAVDDHRDE
ncbi:MAG: sugar phosphate isomerase/epimerase family protein, partial [Pirellulales bacterium]|nr:sugar phosphate isomerase/epimerase family protein [Pirellulales bacterium]